MSTSMHHRLWARLGFAVFAIAFVAIASGHETAAQSTPKAKAKAAPRTGPITWKEFETWVAKELEVPCQQVLPKRGIEYADPETLANIMAKFPDTPERGICRDAARALMPGVPDVALVEKEGPALLEQLGQAVRSRNDAEVKRLVHPALLVNQERVYAAFSGDGQQALVKFSPTDQFDRVGVQVYRLVDGVESLNHVQFALLKTGEKVELVVREIVPDADLFLREEKVVAVNKLRNLFRALNSRDASALQEIATPGLYETVKDVPAMGGGSLSEASVTMTPSVSTVDNTARPVVRVTYLTRSNRNLQFDVDFERIDGDLRVVRLRDVKGHVIAYDPDIYNYMRRRYGLADGPRLDSSQITWTEEPCYQSARLIQTFGRNALHGNKSDVLMELAECVSDFLPDMGYSLRAAAHQIRGNFEGALADGRRAIEAGGTAYFLVTHHIEQKIPPVVAERVYQPVVIAVSKDKIGYLFVPGRPVGGRDEADIPIGQIVAVHFDRRMGPLGGPRPFLSFKFRDSSDKNREKTYNFAPAAAHCASGVATPPLVRGAMWEEHPRTVCSGDFMGNNSVGTRVPSTWRDELGTLMHLIHLVAPKSDRR